MGGKWEICGDSTNSCGAVILGVITADWVIGAVVEVFVY